MIVNDMAELNIDATLVKSDSVIQVSKTALPIRVFALCFSQETTPMAMPLPST